LDSFNWFLIVFFFLMDKLELMDDFSNEEWEEDLDPELLIKTYFL
jgi:hypothetical protein